MRGSGIRKREPRRTTSVPLTVAVPGKSERREREARKGKHQNNAQEHGAWRKESFQERLVVAPRPHQQTQKHRQARTQPEEQSEKQSRYKEPDCCQQPQRPGPDQTLPEQAQASADSTRHF